MLERLTKIAESIEYLEAEREKLHMDVTVREGFSGTKIDAAYDVFMQIGPASARTVWDILARNGCAPARGTTGLNCLLGQSPRFERVGVAMKSQRRYVLWRAIPGRGGGAEKATRQSAIDADVARVVESVKGERENRVGDMEY